MPFEFPDEGPPGELPFSQSGYGYGGGGYLPPGLADLYYTPQPFRYLDPDEWGIYSGGGGGGGRYPGGGGGPPPPPPVPTVPGFSTATAGAFSPAALGGGGGDFAGWTPPMRRYPPLGGVQPWQLGPPGRRAAPAFSRGGTSRIPAMPPALSAPLAPATVGYGPGSYGDPFAGITAGGPTPPGLPVSALFGYYNLLRGGGQGTMFDPTGNYRPYLSELEREATERANALIARSRLRAQLSPDIDPSQRAYAGLIGEASAFGGAQGLLGEARRSLAERNQAYIMNLLNQLYATQTGGPANPFVDWNLIHKRQLELQEAGQPPWWQSALQGLGQGAGAAAGGRIG